jgi:Uma2 family endonuclease
MTTVTPAARLITGEELAHIPGVGPCELVEGRVVPMSPGGTEHSLVTANAVRVLSEFVRTHRLGKVLTGEVGLYTRRDPDTVRGADVAYISADRFERRTRTLTFLDVAPELIVEVLSRDDTMMDLTAKLREYFAVDVKAVWIVDPRARRVYAYRSAVALQELTEADTLLAEDVLPGFMAPVAALFEEEA